jgi:hypothetical protein
VSTYVQPDLFAQAWRDTDPDTSRDAFVIGIHRHSDHRERALSALLAAGPNGLTDFELADVTGIKQTSIGKRRHELMQAGHVEPLTVDGRQVRRAAPSGASAGVYVAVLF